jgi:hypothetical protein
MGQIRRAGIGHRLVAQRVLCPSNLSFRYLRTTATVGELATLLRLGVRSKRPLRDVSSAVRLFTLLHFLFERQTQFCDGRVQSS